MPLKKPVELLAPAGNWQALEEAVKAGADAVYLGGKRFNMRLHRDEANFDDAMLKEAIKYAHNNNVLVYITVNNLYTDNELAELYTFLAYLHELKPDALIIQDLAVIKLTQKLNCKIPLHASVMLNSHNFPAISVLESLGVKRVVVSRELSLAQLALLKQQTTVELEYFVHRDMCISHSGQCLHSGIVLGAVQIAGAA